jgi:hypothetical protein
MMPVTERVSTSPGFHQKRVAIRHRSSDRLVSILELVSPGNKDSRPALRKFVGKIRRCLEAGIHATVLDPLPPTARDPRGIHDAIWRLVAQRKSAFPMPADRPLTFVAYEAILADDATYQCYVKRIKVGDRIPDIALFLEPGEQIQVPVEECYLEAFGDVPPQYRTILEAN